MPDGAEVLVEKAGQGHDLVISTATLTLGSNFEDLTLAGGGAINGTGNSLANRIEGNNAENVLIGGAGADFLIGGGGADSFAFLKVAKSTVTARDTILDSSRSRGDTIDLSGIDANGGAAGEGFFVSIRSQGFHGVSGELCWTVGVDGAVVQGDTNGDGVADLEIFVAGAVLMRDADFVL